MVKEVRRRRANPQSIPLLVLEAPINRERDLLRAGADNRAYCGIAETADVVRREREGVRIDPIIDAFVGGIDRNTLDDVSARIASIKRVVEIGSRWISAGS